jgi:hypothetical protein
MARYLKSVGVGLLLAFCGAVVRIISLMIYYSPQQLPGSAVSIDLRNLAGSAGFQIVSALLFLGGFYIEYKRLTKRL